MGGVVVANIQVVKMQGKLVDVVIKILHLWVMSGATTRANFRAQVRPQTKPIVPAPNRPQFMCMGLGGPLEMRDM